VSESQKCKNGKNPALPKGGAGFFLYYDHPWMWALTIFAAITILWMSVILAAITILWMPVISAVITILWLSAIYVVVIIL